MNHSISKLVRRHQSRWALLPSLLLVVGSSAAGVSCTKSSADQTYFGRITPRHGPDELWINNGGEPEWIDPGKCSDGGGGEIIWNLFAGLAEAHPATLDPIPDVAKSWQVSTDGRTYTFYLRESTWSDGHPLTADDFAWSWRRVLDPQTGSKYASILYVLKNGAHFARRALHVRGLPPDTTKAQVTALFAQAGFATDEVVLEAQPGLSSQAFVYLQGVNGNGHGHGAEHGPAGAAGDRSDPQHAKPVKNVRQRAVAVLHNATLGGQPLQISVTDAAAVGVHAHDAHTLVVELEYPVPYFLNLVTFYTFMPVPRHLLDKLKRQGQPEELWTRPENIVSNGAYKLKEWAFRQYLVYERNDRYWNAAATRTKKIVVSQIESYNTTLNMYRAGELDWIGGNTSLPSEFMTHLSQFKDFRRSPYLAVYFYWVNTKAPPMDNPLVRQALALAIDREAVVKYVTKAGQIPTSDLVPDGLAGYQGLGRPLFDPERAKGLLRQAGYNSGSDVPEITLIYNTSEGHKQIAEAIQQMWRKHLGVSVQIENQEWKVYLKNLQMMNFQMARMGWVGDYADPNTFLHDVLTCHAGNNHSNWCSSEYDALIKRANDSIDPQERLALMRQAEAMALGYQPLIPIYVYTRSDMAKPYVKGMWSNYQDRHLLKYMWVDPRWYDGIPKTQLADPPPAVARME